MDSNYVCVKILKVIMQGADAVNACRCMLKAIAVKHKCIVNNDTSAPVVINNDNKWIIHVNPIINNKELD